jgi:hypothetical protein
MLFRTPGAGWQQGWDPAWERETPRLQVGRRVTEITPRRAVRD